MSAAVVMPAAAAAPSPVHHNRPSRANVAAKTFQCTECSAVLISPTEFQLHIENRHMNDSTNDEDSDVDAVTEDDFGKSMAGAAVAVGGGGNKHKSPSSSSSRSSPSLSSSSEDLRCSFCSKHFTRKLDLAHHLEDMHCRERCLYGKCGAVFTGKQSIVCHIESSHSRPSLSKLCRMCGANAGTETGLLNHILAEHLERACGMCTQFKTTSTSAEDGNSLLDHIRLNHSFYVFVKKCDNCPSVFRDQNALADHHAAVHQERYCKSCSLTFRGVWRYREHIREKHPLAERELNINSNNVVSGGGGGGSGKNLPSGGGGDIAATEANKAAADTATFLAPAPPPPSPRAAPGAHHHSGSGSSPGFMTVRCPLCSYQSSQKSNLTRHFESFHLTYKCRICRERIFGRKKIIEHVHREHGSTDTRYDIRDADSKREMGILNRALAKPSLLSTSPSSSPSASSASNMALNEYRCPRCPFVAHYQLAWIRHKSVCKKSSAAASSDVGAGKSNEENRVRGLTPAERRHVNQAKNYSCPKCISKFRTARSTALHLKEEHGVRCVVKKDEAGNKIIVEESRKRKRSSGSAASVASAAAALTAEERDGGSSLSALTACSSSNVSSATPSNHNSDTETAFEDDDLASASAMGLAPNSSPDPFLKRDLAKKFRLEYESFRRLKCDEFQEYLRINNNMGWGDVDSPDVLFNRAMTNVMGGVNDGGVAAVVEMKESFAPNFIPAAFAEIYDE